jgi:ribonuclease D
LQATYAHWLGGDSLLDKEQQRSDWSVRPLSSAQLVYAALDAAACNRQAAPHLL